MIEHYSELPVSYYSKDHWFDFARFFNPIHHLDKVLNVGCGRGSSLMRYTKGCGVDFNPRLAPVWKALGIADRCELADVSVGLPWASDEFVWAYSTDFLEHLQPDAVEPALQEILRVAPRGRHVIDMKKESGYRGPRGENLHPSANDELFWTLAFRNAGAKRLNFERRNLHLFVSYGDPLD